MKEQMTTGAALLVEALQNAGVETVFGIPGVHNLKIYDALTKSNIRHIATRNESGAGFMADGYARRSGKVGTAIVITGPGLTNIMTPMGQAYHDSIPMVVISSQLPTTIVNQRTGFLHELKNSTIMAQSVTKMSRMITSADQIEHAVYEAYALAQSGRPGPVHLEVPLDILAENVQFGNTIKAKDQQAPFRYKEYQTVDHAVLEKAITLIDSSDNVAIIAGGGACGAVKEVNQLAVHLSAPVVQTCAGKGIVSDFHPLSMGTRLPFAGIRAFLEEQDVVIAIGTQLAPTDLWEMDLSLKGKLIQIDIDSEAFYMNIPSDLGLKGDAKVMTAVLLEKVQPKRRDIEETVKALKDEAIQTGPAVTGNTKTYHIAMDFIEAAESALGEDGVLVADMTTAAYIALSEYHAQTARSFLHPVGFGTLGYAMPAAIGAKVADPDQSIIALNGDGGFQFTMQELAVACTLKLPLPVVIWNNGGYGEIKRNEQAMAFETLIAVDQQNPDFTALAAAYGIEGIRVHNKTELLDVLTKSLKKQAPTVIEINVEKWEG
ncbi:5-guanidino-2-oxopentanoate decarboxylase [Fusibacter paucivorans]|uniref:5-guanidino-2-oxopentanoate decarboxylase n=1 Tax=Fusibacter paucivorans TaxID=76009 RepID=A0ABS5PP58_9FIRM|nr:5-guanidino-2-oxopentanoate decarboxylase [Fusibacter paucivorans]MBS7526366.1 5-guanidino-2-oxopentanoate decarboxylase [Fusibacter paucivorans]